MADEFDIFIASALAPPERAPDRRFVARVQDRIEVEGRFQAERRTMIAALVKQLIALAALCASVWWLGKAAIVANWFAEAPAVALTVLLAAFAFVLLLVAIRSPLRPLAQM